MAASRIDYDKIKVEAAYSVLLELAHLLREYQDGIVVVGGWVPELMFDSPQQAHVGSIDVDLALDQQILQEVGYRSIMELLLSRGYQRGEQPFIFYRMVTIAGNELSVEVDFQAAEYGGTGKRHRTQKVQDIQPRKARGCDLAFQRPELKTIEGSLPDGAKDKATVRIASIVPFLMMKSQALKGRMKEKDAYDIYFCLLNYPGGLDALAVQFILFTRQSLVVEGLHIFSELFQSPEHVGPKFVADFLEEHVPETRAGIQRDVFERMDYLLRPLGIRN